MKDAEIKKCSRAELRPAAPELRPAAPAVSAQTGGLQQRRSLGITTHLILTHCDACKAVARSSGFSLVDPRSVFPDSTALPEPSQVSANLRQRSKESRNMMLFEAILIPVPRNCAGKTQGSSPGCSPSPGDELSVRED